MEKWKKVLRIVLRVLACAALGVAYAELLRLPRQFGVEWIIGWPEFLSNLLTYGFIYFGVFLIMPKSLRWQIGWQKPKSEQTPAQVKKGKIFLVVFLSVLLVGMSAAMSLTDWRKVDRYERSRAARTRHLLWLPREMTDPGLSTSTPCGQGFSTRMTMMSICTRNM